MKLSVSEFAKMTGVSVRTLHYYDEIGLLKADCVDEYTGYRFYGERAFGRMQEILFYRELDFSLKLISEIISSPNYNKQQALESQKQLLKLKIERLEKIVAAIERGEKGEQIMDFKAFDKSEIDSYKNEVKSRWGDTAAYKESEEKTAGYTADKWNDVAEGLNAIIAEFSLVRASGEAAEGEKAAALVKKLQDFITETQYHCTKEILSSLGEMYVSDERFKNNIDKSGEGTAQFMSEAIKSYCSK